MLALGVNLEAGIGSIIPIQATRIDIGGRGAGHEGHLSMIHATGNIQKIMDESRKVATTAILYCAKDLGIDVGRADVAMTGEIDTQGRILGVGALDLKLETACDAGCKTMIIPKENLGGPRGIEGLLEALKRELQIFTYEQWKGEHEPFDYERHTLQVIGVEHIAQAADRCFVDDDEINELEMRFVNHGRKIGSLLAGYSKVSTRISQVLLKGNNKNWPY